MALNKTEKGSSTPFCVQATQVGFCLVAFWATKCLILFVLLSDLVLGPADYDEAVMLTMAVVFKCGR